VSEDIEIFTLAERLDLGAALGSLPNTFPEFMHDDAVVNRYWARCSLILRDSRSRFATAGMEFSQSAQVWRRLIRSRESPGLRSARRESTEKTFAPGLSKMITEIRATITFIVRNSGEPRPVPSRTPP
jgi:hypothetical protein